MPLSPSDVRTQGVIALTVGLLSLIGSALIITAYCVFKHNRNFKNLLVVYLSGATIWNVFPNIIALSIFLNNGEIYQPICSITGAITLMGNVATNTWTTVIALYVYLRVVHGSHFIEEHMLYIHILAWGYPIIQGLIPFMGAGGYARNGAWCYAAETLPRLTLAYTPAWACLLSIAVLYTLVGIHIYKIKKGSTGSNAQMYSRAYKKLALFPVIHFIGYTPPSINRIQGYVDPTHPVAGLYQAQAFFLWGMGFANCLVYGYFLLKRQRKGSSSTDNTKGDITLKVQNNTRATDRFDDGSMNTQTDNEMSTIAA